MKTRRKPQTGEQKIAILEKLKNGRKVRVYVTGWAPRGIEGAIIKQGGRTYLAHKTRKHDGGHPVFNHPTDIKCHHDLPYCLEITHLIRSDGCYLEVLSGSYSIRNIARTYFSEETGRTFYITSFKVISGCHAIPFEDVKAIADIALRNW